MPKFVEPEQQYAFTLGRVLALQSWQWVEFRLTARRGLHVRRAIVPVAGEYLRIVEVLVGLHRLSHDLSGVLWAPSSTVDSSFHVPAYADLCIRLLNEYSGARIRAEVALQVSFRGDGNAEPWGIAGPVLGFWQNDAPVRARPEPPPDPEPAHGIFGDCVVGHDTPNLS